MIVDWVAALLALLVIAIAFLGWEFFKIQFMFSSHQDLLIETAEKHNVLAKRVHELTEQMGEAIDEIYDEFDKLDEGLFGKGE